MASSPASYLFEDGVIDFDQGRKAKPTRSSYPGKLHGATAEVASSKGELVLEAEQFCLVALGRA